MLAATRTDPNPRRGPAAEAAQADLDGLLGRHGQEVPTPLPLAPQPDRRGQSDHGAPAYVGSCHLRSSVRLGFRRDKRPSPFATPESCPSLAALTVLYE